MKRAAKWIGWAAALPVALLALFMLTAWIGSAIPRNAEWIEPESGVAIMVETNGVHTALVMPLVSPQKDWRLEFPSTDLPASTRPYTHVSISWGEREVFLNTPTWNDITPATILGALAGGDSLLHVSHYVRPAPSETLRTLRITQSEYAKLVRAIENTIIARGDRAFYPGYFDNDVFYDARGTYHLGNTCNQWTSDMLAAAGVKAGMWTPLAGGVMRWVPEQSLDN